MKKVLFAMLVSGMLFSCTNNTQSEEQGTTDSTVQVTEGTLAPVEEVAVEVETPEVDTTAAEVTTDSVAVAQ